MLRNHSVSSRCTTSPDPMVFIGRGPAAAADADDHDHRFADASTHGDSMHVIRDALLSQLQEERLRQEIMMAEIARIERAMALRPCGPPPSHRGTASSSAIPERANPTVHFPFDEQFVPHSRGTVIPEHHVGVDEVRDLKMEVGVLGCARIKSEKPAMEDDLVPECWKTPGSNGKPTTSKDNAAGDQYKPDSEEAVPPEKISSSVKWSCGICQVEASSKGNLMQHFAGQKHRANIITLKAKARADKSRKAMQYAGKPGPTWVCKFCSANCPSKSHLDDHLKGKKHNARIQVLLEECESMTRDHASREADSTPNTVTQDEGKPDSLIFCGICQVKCTSPSVKESHVRGKKHWMNFRGLQLEAKRLGITPPKIVKKQEAPPDRDCTISQAKCISESQFHDHGRSMGHRHKIDALQREGINAHSYVLETGKKSQTDGSNSNDDGLQGEVPRAIYFCKLCNLQCNSKNTLAEHRRGRKHLVEVEKRRLSSFCNVCNLQCNSEKMLAHHCTGSKHQANLKG